MFKLAGDIKVGDNILWDGVPARVLHADKYRTAMLPGVQVELMVTGTLDGETFSAATVVDAGDAVIMA